MKVNKIMSKNIGCCGPNDSVSEAVRVMWERDCGFVPVVAKDEAIGVVTDRDIAIFVGSQNRLSYQIMLGELVGGEVISCREKESVKEALKKMTKHGIRRLPVTGKKGKLKGIISIADVLAVPKLKKSLRKKAMSAMIGLSKPRRIVLNEETD